MQVEVSSSVGAPTFEERPSLEPVSSDASSAQGAVAVDEEPLVLLPLAR